MYLNFFSEGYPPLVFPTMQLMVEALNLHVISVAWDLQYLTCLAESSRTKIKPMNVTDMNSGTMVTKPGKLFYDTLLVSNSTPKTRFSKPRFSEILDVMNKFQLPFSYFTLYPDSI